MSMRTKKSFREAGSRIRRRLSTHVARSTSMPSWVSFSEMFRSMPDATMTSINLTYSRVAAAAPSSVFTPSPRWSSVMRNSWA